MNFPHRVELLIKKLLIKESVYFKFTHVFFFFGSFNGMSNIYLNSLVPIWNLLLCCFNGCFFNDFQIKRLIYIKPSGVSNPRAGNTLSDLELWNNSLVHLSPQVSLIACTLIRRLFGWIIARLNTIVTWSFRFTSWFSLRSLDPERLISVRS